MKIYDKDKCPEKSLYFNTLKEFPDLPKRMRVKVSLSVEIPLKELKLKKIKRLAYNYLEEKLLNEKIIRSQIATHSIRLANFLKAERENGTLKISEFIEIEVPLEYNQLKEAANIAYDVSPSKEKFLKIAKVSLTTKEIQGRIIIIEVFKTIQNRRCCLKNKMCEQT